MHSGRSRLAAEGRIDVLDAARRLEVAPETIRRDLRTLEREGGLQRVHGGAVPVQPGGPAPGTAVVPSDGVVGRDRADPDRPAPFGQQVWARLPRAGTLLLGPGRLSLCLARVIAADPPAEPGLTVVTNALDAAVLLSRVPQLSVYNLGGAVDPGSHAQQGDWAITELRRLRTDVAVIGPAGVSVQAGLTEATPAAAAVGHAVVATGQRLVVLADQRTLGAVGFVRFASIGAADELAVLGPVDPHVLTGFAERGVRLTVIEEPRDGVDG